MVCDLPASIQKIIIAKMKYMNIIISLKNYDLFSTSHMICLSSRVPSHNSVFLYVYNALIVHLQIFNPQHAHVLKSLHKEQLRI